MKDIKSEKGEFSKEGGMRWTDTVDQPRVLPGVSYNHQDTNISLLEWRQKGGEQGHKGTKSVWWKTEKKGEKHKRWEDKQRVSLKLN